MNIVEYAENVLGVGLLEYQKTFIRKLYDAYAKDGTVSICMPRKCGRTSILRLMELFREYKVMDDLDIIDKAEEIDLDWEHMTIDQVIRAAINNAHETIPKKEEENK